MLPRLRLGATRAIGLLEKSVSSPEYRLKQTKETPGYVRRYHKVEVPPGAKATQAAMPKHPSPLTRASSSVASFSSLFSWNFHPSFSRKMLLLGTGALGALGAGALLYSVSGNADGGDDRTGLPFFNRDIEQKAFKRKFNDEPGVITILIGPPSCGKSRFLKELAGQFEADETAPPFLYIDSRVTAVRTPEALSKTLANILPTEKIDKYLGRSRFKSLLSSLAIKGKWSWSLPFFNDSLETELAKELKKDEVNLELTIEKYEKILEALNAMPRKPVIVIDEANNLMDWTEKDSSQPKLQGVLDFLVSISKQNNLAHVILATSDYFLAKWLAGKGLAEGNFEVEVLGDLTKEEGKVFFIGDAKKAWPGIISKSPSREKLVVEAEKTWPAEAEEHWPDIYERCGGNIGKLKQFARAARSKGNWESALKAVVANSRTTIEQGFDPAAIPKRDEPPRWTEDQWQTVLERITTAPHHAVLRKELMKELGKGDFKKGRKIIFSMVKYNLLALRPFSELARDLPLVVYGGGENEVVTLPSPGHVWAAKRVLLERKSDVDRTWLKRTRIINMLWSWRKVEDGEEPKEEIA